MDIFFYNIPSGPVVLQRVARAMINFNKRQAFYAGLFLGVGEVSNMAGVASCVPIANKLGKKMTIRPPQSKEGRLKEIYA